MCLTLFWWINLVNIIQLLGFLIFNFLFSRKVVSLHEQHKIDDDMAEVGMPFLITDKKLMKDKEEFNDKVKETNLRLRSYLLNF